MATESSEESGIEITPASPFAAEATALIEQMTTEMAALYGRSGTGHFHPEDADGLRAIFMIARSDGRAVGCGALRPLSADTGEIKRMFVVPEDRGRGISRLLLAALESAALQKGYSRLRLHTGVRQPAAIRLYESVGYARIPIFPPYENPEIDLCFEKLLSN